MSLAIGCELGDRIRGWIDYNSDLVEVETIEKIVEDLRHILQLFIDRPDSSLKQIQILLQTEEDQKEHEMFMESITTKLSEAF